MFVWLYQHYVCARLCNCPNVIVLLNYVFCFFNLYHNIVNNAFYYIQRKLVDQNDMVAIFGIDCFTALQSCYGS